MRFDLNSLGKWLVAAVLLVGCFDALFEEGVPVDSPWQVCCRDINAGRGHTGSCLRETTCRTDPTCVQPWIPCVAEDVCCASGAGGGSGTGGGSGAGGGGFADAGSPLDAGVSRDAGVSLDAGVFDAGVMDAGVTAFELCCRDGRLTTCACPPTGCLQAPLTVCGNARCVAGTSHGACP